MTVVCGKEAHTGWRLLLTLVLLAATPQIFMALALPSHGGDWTDSYLPVAMNIIRNGCVSVSDPMTALCLPSWGGNQLPGYPAFVAAIWSVFPGSIPALLIAQIATYAASVVYLSRAISFLDGHKLVPYVVAVALMLSPQLLPWSRFAQTELLSISITLWFFAELVRSISERKLRVLPVGLALAVAIFLRYDGVVLVAPAIFVGFWLHDIPMALRRGLAIALITAVPFGAWTIRSVSLGLSATPELGWHQRGGRGFLDWGFSWSTSQYEHPKLSYPIVSSSYSLIQIDPAIYVSGEERRAVEGLLKELRNYEGRRMPDHIDNAFAELADIRRTKHSVLTWLVLPAIRAKNLWFNPYNSHGWPVSVGLGGTNTVTQQSRWARALTIAKRDPLILVAKVGNAGWRLIVLLGVAFLYFLFLAGNGSRQQRAFVTAVLVFALTRTILMAELGLAEARYMLPAVAMNEVAFIILCFRYWETRHRPDLAVENE